MGSTSPAFLSFPPLLQATVYLGAQTSQSVFFRHLRQLEVARLHYMSYLRQLGNLEEAADIHE